MAVTVAELAVLGYTVGVAHGAVDVEEQALEQARKAAGEDVVAAQAQQVTQESLGQLAAAGQLPPEGTQRQQLAARIADQALTRIQTHADDQVAFHERAVQAAKDMPTVWHVSGYGVAIYVPADARGRGADKDARRLLDQLADHAAAHQ